MYTCYIAATADLQCTHPDCFNSVVEISETYVKWYCFCYLIGIYGATKFAEF